MYGASILAIAFGFLVSIFNSRILGPESFGDYKFIQTVASLIGSLVSVGLFISLTRLLAANKDKIKEQKYSGLVILVYAVVSVIGMFLMFCFSFVEPYFFEHGLEPKFKVFFFIVAPIVGLTALKEVLKGMHNIYALSLLSFAPALVYLAIIYPLSKVIHVDIDLVLLITHGVGLLLVGVYMIRLKPNFSFEKSITRELFQENKWNGRPIYFGSLAGVATQHIAGLSISYFLDNTQVGFFLLAITVCSPLLVIPSVLGTIFFKQFVSMDTIPKNVFLFSILSTLIALLIFYSLIEFVILTFYTEDYIAVADISKFLIIAFIFHGLGDLFNRFLGAKGKGKILRNAAYIVGIVNVLGYTILVSLFKLDGAIFTKILASAIYLLVMWLYYLGYIRKNSALVN